MFDPVFDAAFYRHQNALKDQDAFTHFVTVGDRDNRDPGPYFSTSFYKSRYPDWNANGAQTALEDFMRRIDAGEARQPHPLIDPADYAARYPDLADIGAEAALHFIRHGDAEGRTPSAGFDAGFYRRCYLVLEEQRPFRHYVTTGRDRGYLPKPQPRHRAQSAAAAASATAALTAPFLICIHDAQPAGVPILTLDLAQAFLREGRQPVFLLQQAGPLLDRFKAIGPCLILAEGWDIDGLAEGLPRDVPVLVNTAAAAAIARALAEAGHSCTVLTHEMADYIRMQGYLPDLIAAQDAGAQIAVSMPRTVLALANDLGRGLTVLRPGIVLPPTPVAAIRRAMHWRRGASGPVFIAAGHADRRKGFDLFLDAATRITAKAPSARFVWLGALDGWAQSLADQALDARLDLTLPGFVADSLAWYRAADVYLLTSRQDPGPTTLIHAAAVGTPFVGYAADIGIIDMVDGLGQFVPPGEDDAYAAAALRMVGQTNPADRRWRRRHVRANASFAAYAAEVSAFLTRTSAVAAT